MRSSSTLVLLFAAAVIQALPIPQYGGYGGAPVPAFPQPPANGYDVGLPPVNPYQNEVPPYTGTEVPPPAESTEVPPPAGTEVPPPAESTEVPPPAGTEVPPPAESTEVPPPAGTEVPPPAESTEVPPPAGTEVPPPAESTEVHPPAGTEVPYPVESTEVPPPVESEVPPPVESQVPPYEGEVPPTETGVPPTETEVPPTSTEVPPTETEVPPTSTDVPPSATEVPPSETQVPPGNTELPPTVYSTPGNPSNYRPQKPTEIECRVSKTGFEPKVMSVKKGDTIKFKVSAGGKFGIRHGGGGDASPCVPLEAGTGTTGGDQTLSYTVPEDASDKIYFYNVEGDKCTKTDMSATLNVGSNLVADSTAPTAGNSTTDGESNARSNLPTLVLAGALSFVASIVQI